MMTLDHALRLIAMLIDTIDAQQAQIDALQAEVARLAVDHEEEPSWPTPTDS